MNAPEEHRIEGKPSCAADPRKLAWQAAWGLGFQGFGLAAPVFGFGEQRASESLES